MFKFHRTTWVLVGVVYLVTCNGVKREEEMSAQDSDSWQPRYKTHRHSTCSRLEAGNSCKTAPFRHPQVCREIPVFHSDTRKTASLNTVIFHRAYEGVMGPQADTHINIAIRSGRLQHHVKGTAVSCPVHLCTGSISPKTKGAIRHRPRSPGPAAKVRSTRALPQPPCSHARTCTDAEGSGRSPFSLHHIQYTPPFSACVSPVRLPCVSLAAAQPPSHPRGLATGPPALGGPVDFLISAVVNQRGSAPRRSGAGLV